MRHSAPTTGHRPHARRGGGGGRDGETADASGEAERSYRTSAGTPTEPLEQQWQPRTADRCVLSTVLLHDGSMAVALAVRFVRQCWHQRSTGWFFDVLLCTDTDGLRVTAAFLLVICSHSTFGLGSLARKHANVVNGVYIFDFPAAWPTEGSSCAMCRRARYTAVKIGSGRCFRGYPLLPAKLKNTSCYMPVDGAPPFIKMTGY